VYLSRLFTSIAFHWLKIKAVKVRYIDVDMYSVDTARSMNNVVNVDNFLTEVSKRAQYFERSGMSSFDAMVYNRTVLLKKLPT